MKYSFKGINVDVTDNFQSKIIDKLSRIEKLYPDGAEANIVLSDIKLDKKVDVTVNLPNKRIIKAEVTSDDLMAAVDEAVDILERQLVKYKSRLSDRAKKVPAFADELKTMDFQTDEYDDDSIKIVKNKKFFVKPMDAEEAVMEMEMLGHSFFVFRDAQSDEVCVVYKRKDGAYGLIEPEF
jgi:ribosomal subunit interface protein